MIHVFKTKGGHRVRAFINGPSVKPGVYDGLLHATDLLPTILNAAIPDGISKTTKICFFQTRLVSKMRSKQLLNIMLYIN